MPKILINEKDRTSPGTPASYANYSVLIAGTWGDVVTGTGENRVVTRGTGPIINTKIVDGETVEYVVKPADSNGVFEFTSADDFLKTIGAANPKIVLDANDLTDDTDDLIVYHYGNQMAYELLSMGYTVLYKPFRIEDVDQLKTADFWKDFKDKSNYDFRFVSHGLLESVVDNTEVDELNKRILVLNGNYNALDAALKAAMQGKLEETDIDLETIYVDRDIIVPEDATDEEKAAWSTFEDTLVTEYEKIDAGKVNGVADAAGSKYDTFVDAVIGVMTERDEISDTVELMSTEGVISTSLINLANKAIADLATYNAASAEDTSTLPGRGDCVALIELDERQYVSNDVAGTAPEIRIATAINNMGIIDDYNGKYCALTVPSVEYTMTPAEGYGDNRKFPAAFHYLSCFMQSLATGFAEWYAAAGYTRGISKHNVKTTSVKLGEIAINTLEPRYLLGGEGRVEPAFACNVIAYFRGSYYLWGNRTAHKLDPKESGGDLVASSFLNIRHLCTTIKKQLYVACRRFTFDPNSDTLWINFVNAIRPTLEAMKADQGVRDYRVLKVFTDKKATLKAKIRIIPIEAVEDFDLEISLEDSFGETAAVVNE